MSETLLPLEKLVCLESLGTDASSRHELVWFAGKRLAVARIISRASSDAPAERRQLQALGDLALGVRHSAIASTIACGMTPNGEFALIEEYMQGPTLEALRSIETSLVAAGATSANAPQRLEWGSACLLARHATDAVEFANLALRSKAIAPIVLVSASRFVISETGSLKLVDVTRELRGVVDSPEALLSYRAPELYRTPALLKGGEGAALATVYSIGVLLFELLTQKRFVVAADETALHARLTEPFIDELPADVPDHVRAIVLGTLSAEPTARIESLRALSKTLTASAMAARASMNTIVRREAAGLLRASSTRRGELLRLMQSGAIAPISQNSTAPPPHAPGAAATLVGSSNRSGLLAPLIATPPRAIRTTLDPRREPNEPTRPHDSAGDEQTRGRGIDEARKLDELMAAKATTTKPHAVDRNAPAAITAVRDRPVIHDPRLEPDDGIPRSDHGATRPFFRESEPPAALVKPTSASIRPVVAPQIRPISDRPSASMRGAMRQLPLDDEEQTLPFLRDVHGVGPAESGASSAARMSIVPPLSSPTPNAAVPPAPATLEEIPAPPPSRGRPAPRSLAPLAAPTESVIIAQELTPELQSPTSISSAQIAIISGLSAVKSNSRLSVMSRKPAVNSNVESEDVRITPVPRQFAPGGTELLPTMTDESVHSTLNASPLPPQAPGPTLPPQAPIGSPSMLAGMLLATPAVMARRKARPPADPTMQLQAYVAPRSRVLDWLALAVAIAAIVALTYYIFSQRRHPRAHENRPEAAPRTSATP